jgi:hypothetical protein
MFKDAVQSTKAYLFTFRYPKYRILLKTIYIFMILEYDKLSRHNNQALQEPKMK